MNLKPMEDLNRKLAKLLEDPHPGLLTWCNDLLSITEQLYKIAWYETTDNEMEDEQP